MSDRFRKKYRQLNAEDIDAMHHIKVAAEALDDIFEDLPPSRETSLARTKLEESVMWAIKGVTG